MGFKDAMMHSKMSAVYNGHRIHKGEYIYFPEGKMRTEHRPISGVIAEYEAGSAIEGRTTLTRVTAGALIAGPAGAIVGGMFKKDRAKGYVTVTFPDGLVIVIDGPLKDEPRMREFAAKVNAAAKHYME